MQFLHTMGCNIWIDAHGTGLTGLLQLANGNENGIVAAFGHNNRSDWISQNLDAFLNQVAQLILFCQLVLKYFSDISKELKL